MIEYSKTQNDAGLFNGIYKILMEIPIWTNI